MKKWYVVGLAIMALAATVFVGLRSAAFLFWAIRNGHERMVRLSFLAGVNPNIRNDSGITPLMEAASYGEVPLANFLLLHGAAVDAADMDGLQAIHWAAREGETSMMSFLLLHGARIDAKDRDDWQPLHYAARNHQDDGSTVRLLLERGANPNAATRAGETPLLIAVDGMSGGTDANALELIAHGADVNVREPGTLETPLMIAMTELSFKSVRVLLCAGADPNVAEKSGRLPIEDALDSEEAAALLAFGSRLVGKWDHPDPVDHPVEGFLSRQLESYPKNDKQYAIKMYCQSPASQQIAAK